MLHAGVHRRCRASRPTWFARLVVIAGCGWLAGCAMPPAPTPDETAPPAPPAARIDLASPTSPARAVRAALDGWRERTGAPGATAALVLADGRGAALAAHVSDPESVP